MPHGTTLPVRDIDFGCAFACDNARPVNFVSREYPHTLLNSNLFLAEHRVKVERLTTARKIVLVMHPEDADLYAFPTSEDPEEVKDILEEPTKAEIKAVMEGRGAFVLRKRKFVFIPKK